MRNEIFEANIRPVVASLECERDDGSVLQLPAPPRVKILGPKDLRKIKFGNFIFGTFLAPSGILM